MFKLTRVVNVSEEQSLGINNFKYLLKNGHFNLVAMGKLNKMFVIFS